MIEPLYRQMEWADATMWRAIAATPAAENDRRLHDLLFHLHAVQHAYMFIWRGEAPAMPDPSTFAGLAPIRDWARAYYRAVYDFLGTIDAAKLDEPFDIPWAKQIEQSLGRTIAAVTLRDTLAQIPLHSMYHRGQVNARLRELGATPPLVDYIAWGWFGKPVAEWP